MLCILCMKPMEKLDDGESWTAKFECKDCKVKLRIDYQDLMGGCLIEKSYKWYENNEPIVYYDKDRYGNFINIRKKK